MADLQKQFLEFHNTIKLGTYEENGFLRAKRDSIINQLKTSLKAKKTKAILSEYTVGNYIQNI